MADLFAKYPEFVLNVISYVNLMLGEMGLKLVDMEVLRTGAFLSQIAYTPLDYNIIIYPLYPRMIYILVGYTYYCFNSLIRY